MNHASVTLEPLRKSRGRSSIEGQGDFWAAFTFKEVWRSDSKTAVIRTEDNISGTLLVETELDYQTGILDHSRD
jgi:hypothetical protein